MINDCFYKNVGCSKYSEWKLLGFMSVTFATNIIVALLCFCQLHSAHVLKDHMSVRWKQRTRGKEVNIWNPNLWSVLQQNSCYDSVIVWPGNLLTRHFHEISSKLLLIFWRNNFCATFFADLIILLIFETENIKRTSSSSAI